MITINDGLYPCIGCGGVDVHETWCDWSSQGWDDPLEVEQ